MLFDLIRDSIPRESGRFQHTQSFGRNCRRTRLQWRYISTTSNNFDEANVSTWATMANLNECDRNFLTMPISRIHNEIWYLFLDNLFLCAFIYFVIWQNNAKWCWFGHSNRILESLFVVTIFARSWCFLVCYLLLLKAPWCRWDFIEL